MMEFDHIADDLIGGAILALVMAACLGVAAGIGGTLAVQYLAGWL